jgi:hypothetical protein
MMNARADIEARRKRYAMYRLGLATKRLLRADGEAERILATRWVNAWSGAIGERWFARGPYGSDACPVVTPEESRSHGGPMVAAGEAERRQTLQ